MRMREFLINAALQGMGEDRLKKYLQTAGYEPSRVSSDLIVLKHDLHQALFNVLEAWGKSPNKKTHSNMSYA